MLLPDKKEQKFQYFPYITCSFTVHHLSFHSYKNILKLILYYHNTECTDTVRGDLHPQTQISACLGVKPAHREIKTERNGPAQFQSKSHLCVPLDLSTVFQLIKINTEADPKNLRASETILILQ